LALVVAEARAQGRKLASISGGCEGFECKIQELLFKIHEIVDSKIDLWHSTDRPTKLFMTPGPGKDTRIVDILKGDGSTMSFHYPGPSAPVNGKPAGQPDMSHIMNDKSFLEGLHTKIEDIKHYVKEKLDP
jgi:hypothetical protein